MTVTLHHGDCREVLATLPAASVEACVCDPPYHLTGMRAGGGASAVDRANRGQTASPYSSSGGFMGCKWDGGDIAQDPAMWDAVLRVLKPGAHLAAFGGTRTHHRMMCAIEDAGFEIRDTVMWVYGSGFPKSLDVGKALDKAAGAKGGYGDFRSPDHAIKRKPSNERQHEGYQRPWRDDPEAEQRSLRQYLPASDLARQWDGWGTALKPSFEPIVLARKPLVGSVAANVARYGTGALNIAACRVESGVDYTELRVTQGGKASGGFDVGSSDGSRHTTFAPAAGRWPANVCHDGSPEVLAAFAAFGERNGSNNTAGSGRSAIYGEFDRASRGQPIGFGDTGTAARFFYTAKASREERNIGHIGDERSTHPTVKPLALMQWLCRLVTPPGGTVLDPFAGSGSTLVAADREGFNGIGIELDAEYLEIARRRFAGDCPLFADLR